MLRRVLLLAFLIGFSFVVACDGTTGGPGDDPEIFVAEMEAELHDLWVKRERASWDIRAFQDSKAKVIVDDDGDPPPVDDSIKKRWQMLWKAGISAELPWIRYHPNRRHPVIRFSICLWPPVTD